MKNLARILIGIVLFLIVLGAIVIFSARGYTFFISHIGKVVFATAAFVLFAVIPYKNYKNKRSFSGYFQNGARLRENKRNFSAYLMEKPQFPHFFL